MNFAPLALGLFLLFATFGLALALLYLGYQLWFHNQRLRVGYLPSYLPHLSSALGQIVTRFVPNEEEQELLELGCGAGHVLTFFRERYRFNGYVGIELDPGWYLLAKWRHRRFKNTQIVRRNVLDYEPDLSRARVIYAYLLPPILAELHRRGRFAGALVITLSFEIPDIAYDARYLTSSLQHGLFVYDFRKNI